MTSTFAPQSTKSIWIMICIGIFLTSSASAWITSYDAYKVHSWNFDEGTGTYANDTTGNFNITNTNLSLMWDKRGYSNGGLTLNYSINTSRTFSNVSNFTINLWMYMTEPSWSSMIEDLHYFILDNRDSTKMGVFFLSKYYASAFAGVYKRELRFYLQNPDNSIVIYAVPNGLNMVTITGNSTHVFIYLNGVYNGSMASGGVGTTFVGFNETSPLIFGRPIEPNITIDELEIWRSVLPSSAIRLLYYSILENSQTYNATTYESSYESFNINLSYDSSHYSAISAVLYYNNTAYPGTKTGSGDDLIFTTSVNVPQVSVISNKTFYWAFALTTSSGTNYFNSTSHNQTIIKGTTLSIGASCIAGFSPAFNISFYYEQNLSDANETTINYYLTYGLSGNNNAYSINGSLSNLYRFSICINNSQAYYDVGYGEIEYGITNSVNRRYYLFGGTRLTNTTVSIPIYNLEYASATQFLVTAQTPALIPFTGYYIALLRWYPQLNSYKIVDMGKTDDKGQTILNVKTNDVDYKLGVYDSQGNIIKLFNSIRLICQTTPCTYSLIVDLNPLDLTTYQNIQSSLTFDSVTKVFTFVWNDPSQTSQTMNLTVYQVGSTSDMIVCSTSDSGYTSLLVCDVSAYSGTLKAQVVRTASPGTIFAQLIENVKETFIDVGGGSLGLFIGAIILIFFALIGTISPIMVVILGIVALVPLFLLGNISWIVLTGFGVIGGVILHFIRRVS